MTPAPPSTPPLPFIPDWHNLKIFLLGAVWALIPALGPAGLLLWHDLTKYSDPIDWSAILTVAGSGAGLGLMGYYQKHKALISPPPGTELAQVVTTVKTVEMKEDPAQLVTTTVQQTKVEPVETPAAGEQKN